MLAPTPHHCIFSHPGCPAYSPCSIHLMMGVEWGEISQCQWRRHWDAIITPINPCAVSPPFPPSVSHLPPPLFPSQLPFHEFRRHKFKCTHADAHSNCALTLKNKRPSPRPRRHLGSLQAALTAVIKECESYCAIPAYVPLGVFSHTSAS